MHIESDMEMTDMGKATHSGGLKSISDGDLCATCRFCAYAPGELSGCMLNWPGLENGHRLVVSCNRVRPKEN